MKWLKNLFISITGKSEENTNEIQQEEYDVYGDIYDNCNTAHHEDIASFDGDPNLYDTPHITALEMYESSIQEITRRLSEQRTIARRPNDIYEMSQLQVREEELILHRELWILKHKFGTPKSDAAKQVSHVIYLRYSLLKKEKLKFDKRPLDCQEHYWFEIKSELSNVRKEKTQLKATMETWIKDFQAKNGRPPVNTELNSNELNRYAYLKLRKQALNRLRDEANKQKVQLVECTDL